MKNKIESFYLFLHCKFIIFNIYLFGMNRYKKPFEKATNYQFEMTGALFLITFLLAFISSMVPLFGIVISVASIFTCFFAIFSFFYDLLFISSSFSDFNKVFSYIKILKMTKNKKIKKFIENDICSFLDNYFCTETKKNQLLLLQIEMSKYGVNNSDYSMQQQYRYAIDNINKIDKEKKLLEECKKREIEKLIELQKKGANINYTEKLKELEEEKRISIHND